MLAYFSRSALVMGIDAAAAVAAAADGVDMWDTIGLGATAPSN